MERLLPLVCLAVVSLSGCRQAVVEPVTSPAPSPDELLGKWENPAGEGMEFGAGGQLVFVSGKAEPVQAKYQRLDGATIELDLRPAVAESFKAKVAVHGDALSVTAQFTEQRAGGKFPVERKKTRYLFR